jgi:hypothetical protein
MVLLFICKSKLARYRTIKLIVDADVKKGRGHWDWGLDVWGIVAPNMPLYFRARN